MANPSKRQKQQKQYKLKQKIHKITRRKRSTTFSHGPKFKATEDTLVDIFEKFDHPPSLGINITSTPKKRHDKRYKH